MATPSHRDIDDLRVIYWSELAKIIPLCRTQVFRLERMGLFPARIQLAPQRVAWRFREVEAWLESRPRVISPPARRGGKRGPQPRWPVAETVVAAE
jgi:prophage regulatory protein